MHQRLQAEEDFTVKVSENPNGQTKIFTEHSGILRKIAVFQQCAMEVFRRVAPTDWICRSSEYLIRLYQQEQCVTCQNIGDFLEKYEKSIEL